MHIHVFLHVITLFNKALKVKRNGLLEFPTLDKLLQILKEKDLFLGGRTTLWKLLKKIGFRYKKVNDKRYVYEEPYWEADNLQEDMVIGEFMIRIDEDDSDSDDEGNR